MDIQRSQDRSHSLGDARKSSRRCAHSFLLLARVAVTVGVAEVLSTGCAPPAADMAVLARQVGIRKPYVAIKLLKVDAKRACSSLLHSLKGRGAKITACDADAGLVAWCEIGAGFNVIPHKVERESGQARQHFLPSITTWRGIVFGSTRLRGDSQRCWLYIHAVSRDVDAATVYESDGAYERSLFNDVTRALSRDIVPCECPESPAREHDITAGPSKPAADYTDLYRSQFIGFVPPEVSDVQRLGQSRFYPVSLSSFWAACLDVIWQRDSIVDVSPTQARLVFADGMSVPDGRPKSQNRFKYVDVLMVLHAEGRSSGGTSVFMAYLPPGTSTPQRITEFPDGKSETVKRALREEPRNTVALLVTDQFLSQAPTQLLFKERWGDRFRRRYSSEGSALPPVDR